MFKEKKLTEKEVKVLSLVTNVNHSMDQLIDSVNDLNIMAMTIVAEKDPKNVTKDMIISLAKAGIDVRDINKDFADVLPECLEISREEETAPVKEDITEELNKGIREKSKEDLINEINERAKNLDERIAKLMEHRARSKESTAPPTGRKNTGNIVHDDLKKRGVIFVRCNKAPEIEDKVVDELIQAATDRDIWIQEFIVNEKDGINKLKAWIESGIIDYIIMNRLEEYNQFKIPQFFFLDEAYRRGIKILLKENDFNPVFPYQE